MAEQENVKKVQDMYAAFSRGDIAMVLANVSSDVTWGTDTSAQEVPWYPIRKGPDGVGDFFATLAREVEFTHFEPTLYTASGNEVIVHVELEYKLKRNGQSAAVGSIHQMSLRDTIVTRFRSFEDTASVRDAWLSGT